MKLRFQLPVRVERKPKLQRRCLCGASTMTEGEKPVAVDYQTEHATYCDGVLRPIERPIKVRGTKPAVITFDNSAWVEKQSVSGAPITYFDQDSDSFEIPRKDA